MTSHIAALIGVCLASSLHLALSAHACAPGDDDCDADMADEMKTSLLQHSNGKVRELNSRRQELASELAKIESELGTSDEGVIGSRNEGEPDEDEMFGLPSSCKAYGCGKFQRGQDCQCTKECTHYGNCCEDYKATCASCAAYKCKEGYHHDQECQCSSKCQQYHNCCEDYAEICLGPTPPPTPEPPTPPYGIFECKSNSDFGSVVENDKKGIALDDTTLMNCADQIPQYWPGTSERVKTVRLFKPWGMTQPVKFHGDMMKAFKGLKGFAKNNNVKFLLGISVTCDKGDDEREWKAGRDFINYVGVEHFMGIAVGNEIDLQVGGGWCKDKLWRGEYSQILKQRVKEFQAMDPSFKNLPITAVLSMNGLNRGYTVEKFLKDAWATYGEQFVFSINIYPQFSTGLKNAGCQGSMDVGSKFSMDQPAGFMPNNVAYVKEKLKKMGLDKMKIWVGELGWSTHSYCVLCSKACHDKNAQKNFYKNFLKWDLSASENAGGCGGPNEKCSGAIQWTLEHGLYEHPEWYPGMSNTSTKEEFQIFFANKQAGQQEGCVLPCDAPGASHESSGPKADHAFYFTMRDSAVFGQREEFGIVEKCGSTRCKF